MSIIHYFAYGTNANTDFFSNCLGIRFDSYQKAILSGWRKILSVPNDDGIICYPNIIRDQNSLVEGILYEIDEKFLGILDEYEDVPEVYQRVAVRVRAKNSNIKAICYIAKEFGYEACED